MAASAIAGAQRGVYRWGICSTGKICNDFAYGSYSELFADPSIDIVYVGAIHPMHKKLVLEALRAKKHVLCEKPMGMNLEEVETMQRVAAENNCLLQEAVWTRFTPLTRRVRDLVVTQKVLGDVKFIQGDFGVAFPRSVKRIWDLEMGGGALLDIGIYPLQFLSCLLQAPGATAPGPQQSVPVRPLSCKVEGRTDPATGVDVAGVFSATFHPDVSAVVSWNALCQTPEELLVTGTKGSLKIEAPAHCATRATLTLLSGPEHDEASRGTGNRVEEIQCPLPPGIERSSFNFPNSELMQYEALAVVEALAEGKLECADYTWAETREVTRLMDHIRKELGVRYPQDQVHYPQDHVAVGGAAARAVSKKEADVGLGEEAKMTA
eukprot:g1516.t1